MWDMNVCALYFGTSQIQNRTGFHLFTPYESLLVRSASALSNCHIKHMKSSEVLLSNHTNGFIFSVLNSGCSLFHYSAAFRGRNNLLARWSVGSFLLFKPSKWLILPLCLMKCQTVKRPAFFGWNENVHVFAVCGLFLPSVKLSRPTRVKKVSFLWGHRSL